MADENAILQLRYELKRQTTLLYYVFTLLFPKFRYTFVLIFTHLFAKFISIDKTSLSTILEKIPDKLFHQMLCHCENSTPESILVSESVLRKLNLPKSCWMKITFISKSSPSELSRYIHVFSSDDLYEKTAYTAHSNALNICKLSFNNGDLPLNINLEKIDKKTAQLFTYEKYMVASEAKISQIISTHENNDSVFDMILKRYFSAPRYLCVGDIFSIRIQDYFSDINFITRTSSTDVIHFKVCDISGFDSHALNYEENVLKGYYIITEETTLYLANEINHFAPVIKHSLPDVINCDSTLASLKTCVLNICPNGLHSPYQELLNCVNPFLKLSHNSFKPVFLISGPKGVGKQTVIKAVADRTGLHFLHVKCFQVLSASAGSTEEKLRLLFSKLIKHKPCIVWFDNIEFLYRNNEGKIDERVIATFCSYIHDLYEEKNTELKELPIILVATVNENESVIPPSLFRIFLNHLHIPTPDEKQRAEMLDWLVKRHVVPLPQDLISYIATRSSGFVFRDLKALLSHGLMYCYKRKKLKNTDDDGFSLSLEDCNIALDTMHSAYSGAIGAPKIPSVTWSDVGGLEEVKEEILRTIMMPSKYPWLLDTGLRRSGLLLYGPPGTGKTLLAKAVATECSLNFLSVKGPELLNMYIGQSEENVREVFERARQASPCIIFFDELDSLAPNRGKSGDSGGVMDRVVSQLLAEMDGLQRSCHLFVIGATNRPDLIDPALLRPGRFDKLLYIGACESLEAKVNVLKALTRKFHLSKDVNFDSVVSALPYNLTGADLYSLCANAWSVAVKKRIVALNDSAKQAANTSSPVIVQMDDFLKAIPRIKPSVSEEDLRYYKKLQEEMSQSS